MSLVKGSSSPMDSKYLSLTSDSKVKHQWDDPQS